MCGSERRNIRLDAPLVLSFFLKKKDRIDEEQVVYFFLWTKKRVAVTNEGCYRTSVARTSSSTILTGEPRQTFRYAMTT